MARLVRQAPPAQEEPEAPGQACGVVGWSPVILGPVLVVVGVLLVIVGLLAWGGLLGWFGHLPGDIRVEHGSVHVYVPIVSMLLVSVVLTLILQVIRRLWR